MQNRQELISRLRKRLEIPLEVADNEIDRLTAGTVSRAIVEVGMAVDEMRETIRSLMPGWLPRIGSFSLGNAVLLAIIIVYGSAYLIDHLCGGCLR